MKKIGPFKIVKKCGKNSYQIDLPHDINLSPIFNVSNLYAFKGAIVDDVDVGALADLKDELKKTIPPKPKPMVEAILDKRIGKKTRRKTYYEYLVQWKGQTVADATWMTEKDLKALGVDPSLHNTPKTRVSFMQGRMVQST